MSKIYRCMTSLLCLLFVSLWMAPKQKHFLWLCGVRADVKTDVLLLFLSLSFTSFFSFTFLRVHTVHHTALFSPAGPHEPRTGCCCNLATICAKLLFPPLFTFIPSKKRNNNKTHWADVTFYPPIISISGFLLLLQTARKRIRSWSPSPPWWSQNCDCDFFSAAAVRILLLKIPVIRFSQRCEM